MNGFWGRTFTFDGIPSEQYSLYISTVGGGDTDASGSTSVAIKQEKVFRNPVPYFYGVELGPVLEFDVSINTIDQVFLSSLDASLVQKWLFGISQYKKLQVIQDDLDGTYFSCMFTEPRIYKSGNLIRGFKARAICDAPYAWSFDESLSKTYVAGANETFTFLNLSDDLSTYVYPRMVITANQFGGQVTLTNLTESNRQTTLVSMQPNEVITIDNELKIITSSTGLKRLSNFNKNWFRFVPNLNTISIVGSISSIDFTYKFPRKVG